MSTKEATRSDDISVTCGICLEASWRSEPKILSCQHTFCLTCLTTLAQQDHVSRQEKAETLDHDALSAFPRKSISCPTCLTVTVIPDGGVSNFQTNGFIQLCMKPPTYECSAGDKAVEYFKSQSHSPNCYQSNNIFNMFRADHERQPSSLEQNRAHDIKTMVTEIVKVAEAELECPDQLRSNSECHQETLSNGSQSAGLGHVAGTCDVGFNQATANVHAVQDVQAMKVVALARYERLKQLATTFESDGTPLISKKVFQEALQRVKSLQQLHCLPQSAEPNSFSNVLTEINSSDVKDVLRYSMENLCTSGPETDPISMQEYCNSMLLHLENNGHSTPGTAIRQSQNCGLVQNGLDRYSELAATVEHLKEICTQMKDNEVLLKAENIKLSNNLKALHQDVLIVQQLSVLSAQSLTRLEDENLSFRHEISQLQVNGKSDSQSVTELHTLTSYLSQELTSLKEEKAVVMKNVSVLQEFTSNLCQELTSLKEENAELKNISTGLERDKNIMLQEMASLKEENLKLEQRSTDLEQDKETLRKEITSLQKENDTLGKMTDRSTRKMALLTTDNAKFKQTLADLERNKNTILQKMSRLQSSETSIKHDIEHVTKQNTKQSKELVLCKSKVTELQHVVCTINKIHKSLSSELSNLEAQMCKTGRQVAFHAILCTELTTSCEQILVNDGVVTNVGNGYNNRTGVFEAPVPGIYLFLFTTSPFEEGKHSRLDLVLDNERVGYLYATGRQIYSAHAAVKMEAGQKAWLRTYGGEDYTFKNKWATSFSGFLVQPEV